VRCLASTSALDVGPLVQSHRSTVICLAAAPLVLFATHDDSTQLNSSRSLMWRRLIHITRADAEGGLSVDARSVNAYARQRVDAG
jgi:hypothetical protein